MQVDAIFDQCDRHGDTKIDRRVAALGDIERVQRDLALVAFLSHAVIKLSDEIRAPNVQRLLTLLEGEDAIRQVEMADREIHHGFECGIVRFLLDFRRGDVGGSVWKLDDVGFGPLNPQISDREQPARKQANIHFQTGDAHERRRGGRLLAVNDEIRNNGTKMRDIEIKAADLDPPTSGVLRLRDDFLANEVAEPIRMDYNEHRDQQQNNKPGDADANITKYANSAGHWKAPFRYWMLVFLRASSSHESNCWFTCSPASCVRICGARVSKEKSRGCCFFSSLR